MLDIIITIKTAPKKLNLVLKFPNLKEKEKIFL